MKKCSKIGINKILFLLNRSYLSFNEVIILLRMIYFKGKLNDIPEKVLFNLLIKLLKLYLIDKMICHKELFDILVNGVMSILIDRLNNIEESNLFDCFIDEDLSKMWENLSFVMLEDVDYNDNEKNNYISIKEMNKFYYSFYDKYKYD